MRIGIDGRVLEKKMTGIGRYLNDILKGLPSFDDTNKYILFSLKKIKLMEKGIINKNYFNEVNTGRYNLPSKIFSPFWLNFVLPSLIEKNDIDIFFSPNNLLPANKLRCKSVVVIHDINHLINKKHLPFFYRNYLRFQMPYTIKYGDIIITISESTKNEIIKFFDISPNNIKVIYPAIDPKFKPIKISDSRNYEIKNKFNLPAKFVLYVGVIEQKKNILGILKIADIVDKNRTDIKFLLVGKPGYGFNKIKEEIDKRNNVIYKNYIEEEYITEIYNLAFLFLFPSYYEGFGLPPLEAMQCGIPVLSSNIKPLMEVVAGNGFVHEPNDYSGYANDILKLLNDEQLYQEMKIRSIERAKYFSYEDSIKKLLEVFNELNNK